MQAATITAALQRAIKTPALAGVYVKSVGLAAPYDLDQPAIMTITWSMPDASSMVNAPGLPGVQTSVLARPSDNTIALPRHLASAAEIEDAVLSAAWQMGAWDCARIEKPPMANPNDWREPRHGVSVDFGCSGYLIAGTPTNTGDASPEAAQVAASHGYVFWRFVPLAIATPIARARWAGKDKTLQPDCTRVGEPGYYRAAWCHPKKPGYANEHQYQLGRANHGNRSKTSKERRA